MEIKSKLNQNERRNGKSDYDTKNCRNQVQSR